MKVRSKSLAIPSFSLRVNMAVLQLISIILIVFLVMGCNTQKTTNNTEQRSPGQRERTGRPSVEEIFSMDANQDGKLAKSELEGPLLRDFSQIDSDGDGFITRTELENAPQPQRGQRPPKNNQ